MKRAVFVVVFACAQFASGGTFTWIGGASGRWSDAGNWQGDAGAEGCPGAGDTALFNATAEITDAFEIASGTLAITNSAGSELHLKGVVSGEGGIFKGGDGSLHLHCGNTFSGGLVSCGTGEYGVDSSSVLSSCVYVYANGALGTGTAQFDPVDVIGTSTGHGALLYCCGQSALEIAVPVTLSGDKASKGNVQLAGGCTALTFKELVTSPMRVLVNPSAWSVVTFEKGFSASNYNIFKKGDYHFKGPVSGTFYPEGTTTVHLYSDGNVYGNFEIRSPVFLYGENVLRQSSATVKFLSANAVVDMNGHDQTITKMPSAFSQYEKSNTFGFLSADDKPAMLRLVENVPSHPDFHGLFQGSAGLEWGPADATKEFCFSNTVQTTCGEFKVSGGILRFRDGAGFNRLGTLTVESGAKLAVEASAGALKVDRLVVEEGGVLDLAGGIALQCGSLTVGETSYENPGTFGANELQGNVVGGGATLFTPQINMWVGDDGDWSDPANWSLKRVPEEGDAVSIASAETVTLSGPTPHLFSLSLSGAAVLVFSNGWDTCLWADEIGIVDATVTVAGAFTNENDKCRAYFKCRNFSLSPAGRIDVDGKGWRGGGYEQTAGISNPSTSIINSFGVAKGGFGPGAANNDMGASHFGYGAPSFTRGRVYVSKISALYDDPYAPSEPGSGGFGLGESAYSCVSDSKSIPSGGGAVFIDASGAVNLDGSVSACGVGSYIGHWHYCQYVNSASTGGSGGAVRINCETISGGGEIKADGGNGGFSVPAYLYNCSASGMRQTSGAAGGGGGIAIVCNPEKQAAGAVAGMKISAAAGFYPEMPNIRPEHPQTDPLPYARMDKYRRDAEPGTLYFSDRKIIDDTIGKSLNGKLFSVENYVYEGDLDWVYGNVRFGATGAVFAVSGNLTVTGEWSRIDIGGITKMTNFGTRPYIHSGTVPVGMTVGGDLVISNGAALAVYAARVDGESVPGAVVDVGGAFVVGDGGTVLPTSDYGYGGAPAFRAGSFTLDAGGRVDADRRGCSGGWNNADYNVVNGAQGVRMNGCGPGAGNSFGAGAGHGGTGGCGYDGGVRFANGIPGGVYGDPYRPVRSGSGGGSGDHTWAGDGGGVFCLEASGSVKLAGLISADGSFHEFFVNMNQHHYAGCGSGGSVLISGATVESTGSARISARGGDAPMMYAANCSAGCGGGGRVAVWTGRDIELASDKPRAVHAPDPFAGIFEGTLVWAGSVDVGGGTNFVLRTDAARPAFAPLPECYGASGTVWFNRFAPQGLSVIVR